MVMIHIFLVCMCLCVHFSIRFWKGGVVAFNYERLTPARTTRVRLVLSWQAGSKSVAPKPTLGLQYKGQRWGTNRWRIMRALQVRSLQTDENDTTKLAGTGAQRRVTKGYSIVEDTQAVQYEHCAYVEKRKVVSFSWTRTKSYVWTESEWEI